MDTIECNFFLVNAGSQRVITFSLTIEPIDTKIKPFVYR